MIDTVCMETPWKKLVYRFTMHLLQGWAWVCYSIDWPLSVFLSSYHRVYTVTRCCCSEEHPFETPVTFPPLLSLTSSSSSSLSLLASLTVCPHPSSLQSFSLPLSSLDTVNVLNEEQRDSVEREAGREGQPAPETHKEMWKAQVTPIFIWRNHDPKLFQTHLDTKRVVQTGILPVFASQLLTNVDCTCSKRS